MKIVQSLNKIDLDKVISHNKIKQLLEFYSYMEEEQLKLENAKIAAKEEITALKKKAYSETVEKVLKENAQLVAEFNLSLDRLADKIANDLANIINLTLIKLGAFSITNNNLKTIIEIELDKFKFENKEIIIRANSYTLEQFKTNFPAINNKLISYLIDDTMAKEECLIESSLWIMRLDLKTAVREITRLLTGNPDNNSANLNIGNMPE